MNRDHM